MSAAIDLEVTSKALNIRMAVAINSEDPDLADDLREMNNGRPEKYKAF